MRDAPMMRTSGRSRPTRINLKRALKASLEPAHRGWGSSVCIRAATSGGMVSPVLHATISTIGKRSNTGRMTMRKNIFPQRFHSPASVRNVSKLIILERRGDIFLGPFVNDDDDSDVAGGGLKKSWQGIEGYLMAHQNIPQDEEPHHSPTGGQMEKPIVDPLAVVREKVGGGGADILQQPDGKDALVEG